MSFPLSRSGAGAAFWAPPSPNAARATNRLRGNDMHRMSYVWLFLLWIPALADQVSMKNGDRLSGSIVKSDGKNLVIKAEFAGAVTIPWDAVTAVTSSVPVAVGLKDGQVLVGTVVTADATLKIATENAGTVTAARDAVSYIRSKDEQVAYQPGIDRYRNPPP